MNIFTTIFFTKFYQNILQNAPFLKIFSVEHAPEPPPPPQLRAMQIPPLLQKYFEPPPPPK